MRTVLLALCVSATLLADGAAASTLGSSIRTTVESFVAAQNAHDLKAVEGLLSDSPEALWITRGTAVWGRADALARFQDLYAGTWHLEPDWAAFRLVVALPQVAEVFVPIEFSIGAPDQPAQRAGFLMNMVLTKSSDGWRIASILPIPAAASPK